MTQETQSKLLDEDKRSLAYFWFDKGDLERSVMFDRLVPLLEAEAPEVLASWRRYKTEIRTLNALLKPWDNL